MKAIIKACLNGIANHDADLSLFKDRKWLTQKLNGLESSFERLSISEEDISIFKANVDSFLEKTEDKSNNVEISAAMRKLTKNIDSMTGYKGFTMP